MSWSVTVNNLQEYKLFTPDIVEKMMTQHIAYPNDMMLALELAKKAGLKSASLTGGRTPSPYGTDEVVDISIRGMCEATDFVTAIKKILEAGPSG